MNNQTILSNVSKVTVKKYSTMPGVIITIESASDTYEIMRIGCHPDISADVKLEVITDDV